MSYPQLQYMGFVLIINFKIMTQLKKKSWIGKSIMQINGDVIICVPTIKYLPGIIMLTTFFYFNIIMLCS